jgi:uncharacterized protein YjcR
MKRYKDEDKAEVLRLLAEGYTYKEVAELTGVSLTSIDNWKNGPARKAKREITRTGDAPARQSPATGINPLLIKMANGNDLTEFIGKDITKMQPREIFRFLGLINVKGELVISQKIKI